MTMITNVPINEIVGTNYLRELFDIVRLNNAALEIVSMGGVMIPLLLRRVRISLTASRYVLLYGAFELAAALMAQEFSDDIKEVDCIIFDDEIDVGDIQDIYKSANINY